MLSASPKAYHTITTYPRRYDERIDTVSDRIRFYRLEAGLTQLQLAAEIGKSRDTILNVEKEPDLVTLKHAMCAPWHVVLTLRPYTMIGLLFSRMLLRGFETSAKIINSRRMGWQRK